MPPHSENRKKDWLKDLGKKDPQSRLKSMVQQGGNGANVQKILHDRERYGSSLEQARDAADPSIAIDAQWKEDLLKAYEAQGLPEQDALNKIWTIQHAKDEKQMPLAHEHIGQTVSDDWMQKTVAKKAKADDTPSF